MTEDEIKRFWQKVRKTSTCWLWIGHVSRLHGKEYGQFRVRRIDGSIARKRAHRVSYELLIGPIPEGKELDHICPGKPVKHCVNPDHLEPVPHAVNSRRGFAAQTSCRRSGHPYTQENTLYNKQGRRVCRQCAEDYNRRRKEARQRRSG